MSILIRVARAVSTGNTLITGVGTTYHWGNQSERPISGRGVCYT